jgi:hypothetical protein
LKALTEFTATDSSSLPHLVAWRKAKQKSDGLVPGGYIIYIMMTLMPGENLLDLKFWSMTEEEREEIRAAFLLVIKYCAVHLRIEMQFMLIYSVGMHGGWESSHTTAL